MRNPSRGRSCEARPRVGTSGRGERSEAVNTGTRAAGVSTGMSGSVFTPGTASCDVGMLALA